MSLNSYCSVFNRVAVVALTGMALIAVTTRSASAADEVILAEQTFDGGGHPYVISTGADASVENGVLEVRGTDDARIQSMYLYFTIFQFQEMYEHWQVRFDFTAQSESGPLTASNTAAASFRWWPSTSDTDLEVDVIPNGGTNILFSGDGIENFFTGEFVSSQHTPTPGFGTVSVNLFLESPTDVFTIDNFQIIGIVPEPTVGIIALTGLAGILLRRSR